MTALTLTIVLISITGTVSLIALLMAVDHYLTVTEIKKTKNGNSN